jgi:hypothetical protein
MKLNQEQKDYLLKVEAEINKMFYEIQDLLSEETNNLMADGLDALSSEVAPIQEEKIKNDKQTDLNFELDKLNMDL